MGGFSQLPAYQPSGNPILDELRTKPPDQWSPMAQQAHAMSGAPLPMPNTSLMAPPPQAPSMGTAPMRTLAPTQPQAAPPSMLAVASQPAAQPPSGLQRAQGEQSTLQSSPAGVDKLPLPARIPLRILDTIGQIFAPRIESLIPGTEGHHQQLLRQSGAQVEQGEKQATEETNRQHVAAQAALATAQAGEIPSQIALRGAQGNDAQARADALANPPAKTPTSIAEAWLMDPANKGKKVTDFYSEQEAAKAENPKKIEPHFEKTDNGDILSITTDPKTGEQKTTVAYKGNPKIKTEVRAIQIGDKSHQIVFNSETGEKIKDLGESGHEPKEPPDHGKDVFDANGKMIYLLPGQTGPPGMRTEAGMNAANTPTMTQRTAAGRAGTVLEMAPEVLARIDANAKLLGPLMGRWDQFMQGKVGMDNPEFAALRSDLLMMSSAVALFHAQGRLPENLRQEFDNAINAPKQTPANLKATITAMLPWLKAGQDQARPGGAQPAAGGAVEQWTRNASGQLVKK